MESTLIYAALVYLMGFRLLIILLGGLCIFLGYRLFVQSMRKTKVVDTDGKVVTSMEAQFGEHRRLSFKNAAPGTFFAAFGAAIVIVVLASSPPAFNFKTQGMSLHTEKGQMTVAQEGKSQALEPSKANTASYEVAMRGDEVPETAEAAHQLVAQKIADALKWENFALEKDPTNAEYHDSLASLYFMTGEFEQALLHQEKAVAFNPDKEALQKRLQAYQQIR